MPEEYLIYSVSHSPADGCCLFYRDDYKGYTVNIEEAGRYTKDDASSAVNASSGEIKMVKYKYMLSESESRVPYRSKILEEE